MSVTAAVLNIVCTLTDATPAWLLWCAVPVLASPFVLAVVALELTLARWLTIALFLARYSLRQMLMLSLFVGVCLTLHALLPFEVCWLPLAVLFVLPFLVFFYIVGQDPDDPAVVPGFIRKAVEARKKRDGDGTEPR
jgi:hypothetical protein